MSGQVRLHGRPWLSHEKPRKINTKKSSEASQPEQRAQICWPELGLSRVYSIQTQAAENLLCVAAGAMLTLGNHFHYNRVLILNGQGVKPLDKSQGHQAKSSGCIPTAHCKIQIESVLSTTLNFLGLQLCPAILFI